MNFQLFFIIVVKIGYFKAIMKIESCLTETFEAGCSDPSQVILIENAFYGRMKVGRCVRYNFGNIGCFKNVVSQLDSLCSMKNFCSFSTADQILIDTKPCPIDFTPYLYVEYLCISVKKLMTCSNIHVTNKPTFMLYEKTIINEKCNSRFWVDSGKKMNITTYNLNLYKNLQKPHQNANHLKSFQSLENFWNVKNFKNCSDTLNIYNLQNQQNKTTPQKLCISNRTDNIIINGDVTNIAYANKFSYLSETYLIKFEGIGCENYKSPLYSHAVRFNSSTSVTCNTSNVHWYLNCVNGQWTNTEGIVCLPSQSKNYLVNSFEFSIILMSCISVMVTVYLIIMIVYYIKIRKKSKLQNLEIYGNPKYLDESKSIYMKKRVKFEKVKKIEKNCPIKRINSHFSNYNFLKKDKDFYQRNFINNNINNNLNLKNVTYLQNQTMNCGKECMEFNYGTYPSSKKKGNNTIKLECNCCILKDQSCDVSLGSVQIKHLPNN